ncbi:helix-turn-helix domain-containing protein, partial [Pseudonocardia sp.]|uniref:helix-turn-helix domain-containing protein n=1 Tax=Pseudonocardia sp. TaxID=60912 RepID=UPI00260C6EAC
MELNGTDPYTWRRLVRRVRLGPSVKLVASMLADYANVDGTSVRPGNDRLVAVTELSDATVRRALKKLRELGLIERVFAGSRTGRKGLADVYRLTYPDELDAYGELLPPDELPPAPVAVTGDTAGTPVTVTGDDVDKPVDNPGTPVAVTADPDPDPPGTPVTDDQPPVTDDRNTGHQYRPPNQAPNQYTPTNKHSGCPDVVAE